MNLLAHFAVGTLGALAVFLLLARLSGETSFSAPFGLIFVGIACAGLAHFLSPWATPAVLLLYALTALSEARQKRRMKRSEAANKAP